MQNGLSEPPPVPGCTLKFFLSPPRVLMMSNSAAVIAYCVGASNFAPVFSCSHASMLPIKWSADPGASNFRTQIIGFGCKARFLVGVVDLNGLDVACTSSSTTFQLPHSISQSLSGSPPSDFKEMKSMAHLAISKFQSLTKLRKSGFTHRKTVLNLRNQHFG